MNSARISQLRQAGPILVTGGSGFIGCNLADALAARGDHVLVFDNFSRPGAREHARWLSDRHGERIKVEIVPANEGEV